MFTKAERKIYAPLFLEGADLPITPKGKVDDGPGLFCIDAKFCK